MNSAGPVWLCVVLLILFGILAFLRKRFPTASQHAQTAVLVAATILFLLACSFTPLPH